MAKKLKKRKTFKLKLTQLELLHMRDLFSVALPPTLAVTLSQSLATAEERTLVESKLWQKLATACSKANIPTDDDAPDFGIVPVGFAPMSVYRVAANIYETAEQPDAPPEEDLTASLFDQIRKGTPAQNDEDADEEDED